MMSEGYVWIITNAVTNELSSMDPSVIDSMGVLGVKTYVPTTKQLQDFIVRCCNCTSAVEHASVTNNGFQKANVLGNSTTDLETLGVSQNGPKLLQALLNTKFRGLSGDFHIVDGQFQSSAYQIVNVISNRRRGLRFWTTKNRIVRHLNVKSTNSISNANLRSITWPSDTTSPPKGWMIPTNGRKLRIEVPVKDGFREFVKVTPNLGTNTETVTGYCINVFDVVMAALPYAVPSEYVPFEIPDGKSNGSYNDMVYQVYLRKLDVMVGDTTIIASRSQYVDFSLPYTKSGLL
ncbi:hypothetical protein ACSBR1_039057 [Camellia fascicularis]